VCSSDLTNTKINDRFIFNNVEMINFPQLEFNADSPYLTLFAKATLNMHLHPVEPCYLSGIRGIYNYKDILTRVNIFSFGALENLDLTDSAITGSIITATAIKSPLENYFDSIQEYFQEYYPFRTQKEKIITSNKKFTFARLDDSESESESDEEVKEFNATDIDIMVETDDEDRDNMVKFDIIANRHFDNIQLNCPDYKLTLTKVDTENKYKYIITGLPRDIEIFQVNDIIGTIAKYHLGCVRAALIGPSSKSNRAIDLYGFPSFITAALTGLNMDFRWTSCNKDLRDIVLKYYQRGFGFLVNAKDKANIKEYMKTNWINPEIPSNNTHRWSYRKLIREATPFKIVYKKLLNPSMYKIGIHANSNHIGEFHNFVCEIPMRYKCKAKLRTIRNGLKMPNI